MSGNAYRIVVELPKSDGFHTKGDRHLAEIVDRRLRVHLSEPHGISGCTVRIEKNEES